MTLVVPITELAAKMPAFAKEIEQGREVVVAPSGGGDPLATVKPARKGVLIGLAKDWGEPRFSEDWTMTEEDLVGS